MLLIAKTLGLLFLVNIAVTAALWVIADIDDRCRRRRRVPGKSTNLQGGTETPLPPEAQILLDFPRTHSADSGSSSSGC